HIEGFSHFVTSMTAPIASGWSASRVGLSPTGKRRLCTAHARTRPLRAYESVSQAKVSLARYLDFYNTWRPHSRLDRNTPDQVYFNELSRLMAA
ncbi:MAG: integrase core domain-containing protein, partial [Gammaproteobacteria bacterium]